MNKFLLIWLSIFFSLFLGHYLFRKNFEGLEVVPDKEAFQAASTREQDSIAQDSNSDRKLKPELIGKILPPGSPDFDPNEIPTNVKILEDFPPIFLAKVLAEMKEVKVRRREAYREVPIRYWMRGRLILDFAYNRHPDERLEVGYIGEDHFFYADHAHPDFAKGYAVSKEDALVYTWDFTKVEEKPLKWLPASMRGR